MKRELKFRAFIHPHCGGGIPQECYNSMDYSDNYELDDFFNLYKPHFFDVMQYTGLKDKNGKDIYENDILKTNHGSIKVVEELELLYIWGYQNSMSFENIEIIGNLHENPELL